MLVSTKEFEALEEALEGQDKTISIINEGGSSGYESKSSVAEKATQLSQDNDVLRQVEELLVGQ